MLTLIAAKAQNGAIGRSGDIPWHAPEDLKLFQRETLGGALIMGRRTWESLPFRPLKNRFNIVVSRSEIPEADLVLSSPELAVTAAYEAGYTRVYGIGGASIYASLLPAVDRMLLTEVSLTITDADTFFPAFAQDEWFLHRQAVVRTEPPACTLNEFFRTPA